MLGVVIWTDAGDNKAIIWCEDHGELAFIGQQSHAAANGERFDQGDLIQFDLAEHENVRLARNPRKIAHHYCSDLDAVIATAQAVEKELTSSAKKTDAQLIDFESAKRLRAEELPAPQAYRSAAL
jgi:hypothetical protein